MITKMIYFDHFTEMVYDRKRESEIVADGIYDDFYFVIVNRGSHPCAYIEITKDHPYYHAERSKYDDLSVHGGVTFAGYLSSTGGKLRSFKNRFFIGWDYAHYGDYLEGSSVWKDDKKWTVKEIIEEDIVPAIHYLKEFLEEDLEK